MPLCDRWNQLYEYTIYETFDYTIICYKRNSVFDDPLVYSTLLSTLLYLRKLQISATSKPSTSYSTVIRKSSP